MSALAPSLVLEAIREMSDQERYELCELLAISAPDKKAEAALLTVQEAARHAVCHAETIRRAIRSHALHASQVGLTWRVTEADLKEWMTAPTPAPDRNTSGRSRQQRGRSAPGSVGCSVPAATREKVSTITLDLLPMGS